MLKIYNGTPHKINIYKKEDTEYKPEIRKYIVKDGAKPIITIDSNGLLNAKIEYTEKEVKDNITIYKMNATGVDTVPENYDIVIVSNLFATVAKDFNIEGVDKLYTVANPVYDNSENPRPVGCLGLLKVRDN